MQSSQWARVISLSLCGVIFGAVPLAAQPARGELTVTAVVQTSVALVNTNGQWTLIVANAPDPADNLSSLIPAAGQLLQAQVATDMHGLRSQQSRAAGHHAVKLLTPARHSPK